MRTENDSKNSNKILIVGICLISIIVLGVLALLFLKKDSTKNDLLLTQLVGTWHANVVEVYNEDMEVYETRGLSQYFGNEITESNSLTFNDDDTFVCEFLNDRGKYEIGNNKVYMLSDIKETSYKAELDNTELVLILEDSTKIYLEKDGEEKIPSDTDDDIKKAEQILYNQFGKSSEETIDGVKYTYSYSYVYVGEYMDNNNRMYHVFDLKQETSNNTLSTVGYYAVSLEEKEYYFVNNTDFKETGIVEIEPKIKNDEVTIYKTGYENGQQVLAKEFILNVDDNLYAVLNNNYPSFNELNLTEDTIKGTSKKGYHIMSNVKKIISVEFGNAGFTHEFIILNDGKVYSITNGIKDGESFITIPIPNLYGIMDIKYEYDESEDMIRYFAVESDGSSYEIAPLEMVGYFNN